MTREEKILKKKARAERRWKKNQERNKISDDTDLPMYARRQIGKKGSSGPWSDSDSPTGYSQQCSYMGTCQYPCNGDC